ncbi:ribose 5-phosphate isomerase A [Candidatus Aerophobetes bacterium]|uniref:Ribose-5-phosphate isomerase A n=1 Tax=Aerophobetes bacterium TaxID=2030807 RepID=A0A2A4YD35_UNCAE|nr:MAG: ribose 5-phosphate isomerase A [Candidatus Aerophobetes bacterium]
MTLEECKKLAGIKAADLIEDGMLIGIGTGSTVFFFIERLIERCKEGLSISAVSSSERSTKQAKAGGITFKDINTITKIDLTVDGADEIDHSKRMIKGGGGALLREKILASTSSSTIIIVDETKTCEKLGKQKLPVEIVHFGIDATIHKINQHGFKGVIRKSADGSIYHTDNNNIIYDIYFEHLLDEPEVDHLKLINIPGVVETGFFFNLANKVIIAYEDGHIEERN